MILILLDGIAWLFLYEVLNIDKCCGFPAILGCTTILRAAPYNKNMLGIDTPASQVLHVHYLAAWPNWHAHSIYVSKISNHTLIYGDKIHIR
jgi:hypothetical protein